jgi:carboxypeptidase Taq
MGKAEGAYRKLAGHLGETAVLQSSMSLLSWDQETHMPPGGAELRARQMAQLAGLLQRRRAAPTIGRLLDEARPLAERLPPDSEVAAVLREARRDYDRAKRIPPKLAAERADLRSRARQAWAQARANNDFEGFLPWLEKVFAMMRRWADALGYAEHPYDALVDDYEPGETAARVRRLLGPLRDSLLTLVRRIQNAPRRVDSSALAHPCPIDAQRTFAREAAAAIGFDFGRGALHDTVHPFCSGLWPGDVRITSRYRETSFPDGFFSLLHEAGHGLYEQGLPTEHFGTPLGDACSYGVHESQSRLWENLVGRSLGFWLHFLPRARKAFPGAFDRMTPEEFHRAVNEVVPSFVRVDADEVTYNLHICLRFELEEALLAGDLAPADLPSAWNERFTAIFGITPPDDREGCLQDVHWSETLVGYFPTYTLGNVYAAQIHERARADLGDLDGAFAKGDFAPLLGWLRERIHRHGRRYPPARLVEVASGAPPSPGPLLHHLETTAARVYGLS